MCVQTERFQEQSVIKTNLTKQEVQERLSKPKKNEVDNESCNQFINDTNGLTISLQQGNSSLQSFIWIFLQSRAEEAKNDLKYFK